MRVRQLVAKGELRQPVRRKCLNSQFLPLNISKLTRAIFSKGNEFSSSATWSTISTIPESPQTTHLLKPKSNSLTSRMKTKKILIKWTVMPQAFHSLLVPEDIRERPSINELTPWITSQPTHAHPPGPTRASKSKLPKLCERTWGAVIAMRLGGPRRRTADSQFELSRDPPWAGSRMTRRGGEAIRVHWLAIRRVRLLNRRRWVCRKWLLKSFCIRIAHIAMIESYWRKRIPSSKSTLRNRIRSTWKICS